MTTGRKRNPRAGEPYIAEKPRRKMAVVRWVGSPIEAAEHGMPALYGAVYGLRFQRTGAGLPVFKVTGLRARWPDAHLKPKDEWSSEWALPVPDDTTELPAKVPEPPVSLETWEYGTVAEVLHLGAYDEEGPNIQRLHAFIAAQGYALAGPHEEEYLTSPKAKMQKTIIRYAVRKAS